MKNQTRIESSQEWGQACAQRLLTAQISPVSQPEQWEVLTGGQGVPLTPEVHARLLELALEAQRSTWFPPRAW